MAQFKPSLLTLALISIGMISFSVPQTTYAQEAEQKPAEQAKEQEKDNQEDDYTQDENLITITGYRGSLVRSLDQKRYADTVSEQLSADDLGALPDVSIADALTRLPGISAVRTGGQAAEINIRGLSGGFILATLNGREQVSTSGTRSVEFDQYPSELIASGAVYKSQKASLIEGGVAGTVELKTASPLDNAENHVANFNLRGMRNDRADEIYDADESGYRFSASYQGKFLDETLGVSLGFARLEQPSVATQFIGLAYNGSVDLDADGTLENPDLEYISEGFEMQHKGGVEVRDGYVAAIEWIPSDTFSLKADAFLSKFDSEQFARGLRVKFGGPSANYYNNVFSGDNLIGSTIVRSSRSFTRVEIANDDDSEIDEVENYGLNATWQLTDNFQLIADASFSSASSDFQNRLLWSLVSTDATADSPEFDRGVAINYRLNGLNLPNASFNQSFDNINTLMPSKYGTYPYEYTDELKAFRLDGVYQMDGDIFTSLEMGIRFSERNYDQNRSVFEYGSDGAFLPTEPPFRLTSGMATPVSWSGDFSYFPGYLAIDIDQVLAAWLPAGMGQPVQTWGTNALGELDNSTAWSVLQSGDVREQVRSFYIMGNIDTEWGDIPVTGNVGVRVVHSEQLASTLQNVNGDVTLGAQNIIDEAGLVNDQYAPGQDGISYTDTLPQLNLNFRLDDNSQIRFSAAKVMSRPPIQWLVSEVSGSVNTDDYEFNATSVNSPKLKPFMANQIDLSYEYYFDDSDGAIIAALYYKDIESFIDTLTIENFDFSTTNIAVPETFLNPVSLVEQEVTYGDYTTRVNNAEGGYIQGFELAYTQVFSMLPEPWSGLGVNMSYAYAESEVTQLIDLAGASTEIPLDGLSDDVLSATLFYSYNDFETRINVRYRSPFVSEQIAVNEQTVFFDSETVVDYQASYNLSDNSKLLFQINNLTDQPTKSYFGAEQFTGTLQYFGRQIFLGISYQL
jgi:TonB-dependent receptor